MKKEKLPINLYIGVLLLCAALAITLIRAAIGITLIEDPFAVLFTLIILLAFVLFDALLIYLIFRGYNWARITFLVIFVVGILLNIGNVITWYYIVPILMITYAIEVLITVIALVLIFLNKTNKWFK